LSRTKISEEKKLASQKLKELLPKEKQPEKGSWRHANNFTYDLEDDIKRLPVVHLKNSEIYRMHMIPRSFDERVKTDVHSMGFKLSSNSIGNFGETNPKL